ncbi:very short patch repair endonuclease [Imhoffiella purpurea]|uniref:Very short patch repair endonuclease n=1 Tax=Imhoffiella purpurea TaxID=1249627 RepID=W9VLG0_9GAMM|nr:DNA mismatch endonuclease Vsr [Imhoffiella purpurea]EXJ16937.1 Very-short-patch mismatch repair endonuclease (G-T specific) [Imhoffiella purpurea]
MPTDKISPQARSEVMRRIRKRDTKPELALRRLVHGMGYRYRLYRKDLPGSPDLVFPGRRAMIFMHGCFWHQHPGCRLARQPKSRPDYWLAKLARNVERDAEVRAQLAALGWKVLVIWKCEITDPGLVGERVAAFLGS